MGPWAFLAIALLPSLISCHAPVQPTQIALWTWITQSFLRDISVPNIYTMLPHQLQPHSVFPVHIPQGKPEVGNEHFLLAHAILSCGPNPTSVGLTTERAAETLAMSLERSRTSKMQNCLLKETQPQLRGTRCLINKLIK